MITLDEVNKVIKKARSEAIQRVTIARNEKSRFNFSVDKTTGKIVIREKHTSRIAKR